MFMVVHLFCLFLAEFKSFLDRSLLFLFVSSDEVLNGRVDYSLGKVVVAFELALHAADLLVKGVLEFKQRLRALDRLHCVRKQKFSVFGQCLSHEHRARDTYK